MQPRPYSRSNWARRLLSLVLSVGLAGAALVLLGRWAGSAAAAGSAAVRSAPSAVIFTVTTGLDQSDNDLTDSQCHTAPAGPCSLRAAVQQLDHDSGGQINL